MLLLLSRCAVWGRAANMADMRQAGMVAALRAIVDGRDGAALSVELKRNAMAALDVVLGKMKLSRWERCERWGQPSSWLRNLSTCIFFSCNLACNVMCCPCRVCEVAMNPEDYDDDQMLDACFCLNFD